MSRNRNRNRNRFTPTVDGLESRKLLSGPGPVITIPGGSGGIGAGTGVAAFPAAVIQQRLDQAAWDAEWEELKRRMRPPIVAPVDDSADGPPPAYPKPYDPPLPDGPFPPVILPEVPIYIITPGKEVIVLPTPH